MINSTQSFGQFGVDSGQASTHLQRPSSWLDAARHAIVANKVLVAQAPSHTGPPSANHPPPTLTVDTAEDMARALWMVSQGGASLQAMSLPEVAALARAAEEANPIA